jgi:hypothetical protein
VSETADGAVLASGLQTEYPKGLGNDDALLLVVGRGDTFEGLEALEGSGTAGSLVRDHATNGSPEHLGGGAEVEGTSSGGVVTGLLAEERRVLHCTVYQSLFTSKAAVCEHQRHSICKDSGVPLSISSMSLVYRVHGSS